MKTEHLLYFTKVVELSSITLASELLYISPQAVSMAIKSLEAISNAKLFIRVHNGLVATKEGMFVYEKAKQILTLLDDIETTFNPTLVAQTNEVLNIAASSATNDYILNKTKNYFSATYPNIQLNFISVDNDDIVPTVSSGQADIGFYSSLRIENREFHNLNDGIVFKAYEICSFDYLTSVHSPFASYASISTKSITTQRLVYTPDLIQPSSCLYTLLDYYHLLNSVWLVDSTELQLQILADNLASALSPRSHIKPHPDLIHIPLSDNVRLVNGYIETRDTPKKHSAGIFIDKFVELQMRAKR